MSRPKSEFFRLFSKIPDVSLVETGTQHGKGIREFIACGFNKIHSIEAHKPYFDNCTKVFSQPINDGIVKLHFGPSETEFRKLFVIFRPRLSTGLTPTIRELSLRQRIAR